MADPMKTFYLGSIVVLFGSIVCLGLSNTNYALTCAYIQNHSNYSRHSRLVQVHFGNYSATPSNETVVSSLGLWQACYQAKCLFIDNFWSTEEKLFNIVTKAALTASVAETLILLLWIVISLAKAFEKNAFTVTLFAMHYLLLLSTGCLYSLYIRATRPNFSKCMIGCSTAMVWMAFVVSFFGIWLLAYFVGEKMSHRQSADGGKEQPESLFDTQRRLPSWQIDV